MPNYLMRYKGEYRLLSELDQRTNDFVRDSDGNIDDSNVYIPCQYESKIYTYGHMPDNKKTVWLVAYIPSLGRGRNIRKALDGKGIEYINYHETDIEVEFLFKAKDIEEVAILMKAKVSGCNISPFSNRNLPRADVEIPTEEIKRYKDITEVVRKGDLLIIHRITSDFLANVLNKKYRKTEGKSFDFQSDMRKLKMGRMAKEYIWTKNMWEEYLIYLKKQINKFYTKEKK